ncbi:RIO1-domain-containing protein [Pyrenochaeta sp. DS3sAY3a]|nr:RIO1-domain-containing protein [Pyrenochaeta sp. DS3sAY3a]
MDPTPEDDIEKSEDEKSEDEKPEDKAQVADVNNKFWSRNPKSATDRHKDKSDRATKEQVLDSKTQLILLQLINAGAMSEINGVVSTGKEANVYHAVSEPSTEDANADQPVGLSHRAVKVYKTSILVFKDRAKYVEGDSRFRAGYNKSNNRAMVKVWAEKERRNLARIHDAGIPSPAPIALRKHVFVMDFVGDHKGKAAPRLKDVRFEDLTPEEVDAKWTALYIDMLAYMRIMYQTCRLVHADLSEYNVLYHTGKQWIIDVSQSVEPDHPRAHEFLRMDVKNVTDFYRSRNVDVLSERKAFAFIATESGAAKTIADLPAMQHSVRDLMLERPLSAADRQKEEHDDHVFRDEFVPRTLDEVYDMERDAALANKASLPYQDLLADSVVDTGVPGSDSSDSDSEGPAGSIDSDGSASPGSGEEVDQSIFEKGQSRGKKHMNKEDKAAHKKAIKEEKREKRKDKIPKYVKKKMVLQGSKKK